ncbi:hypothetical protein MAPG_02851 [Magnaporthiopsis poae ATCC 64411]|uniref:Gylcosyl hydrolase 115 C-terminal domain-containing protein n=1 Tax=Magnaporthiopsis poae (strain ATCC 64411 / 73-15) TaxID=644358 RepID=A0A0C4DSH1_MAGP6|nr:hypothetical protein MAPG_02851 [Magnaporthiopsis poae ATCC 64411]
MVALLLAASLAASLLSLQCFALLEEELVTFQGISSSATGPGLDIADAALIYDQDDFKGVQIAVQSLWRDLDQITGHGNRQLAAVTAVNASIPGNLGAAIIVGSVNSSLIRQITSSGALSLTDIEGRWESFKTSVVQNPLPGVDNALVIAGSDKRGTIFGVYTLSEQCGQSPYHWFADVPAQRHTHIYALPKTTVHGEPSVRYRGLFINDEEPALNQWWARRHNATRWPLDREFYAHVFDLLLRLRANFLWPAMWKSFTPPPGNIFFTDDPGNQQLADDYGIVISTAHHEPMQRATNEWDEVRLGPWDWSRNRDNITRFMDEGVRRAGKNESYFTIGMRGLGDEAANTANAIEMLKDVFRVQRGIIKKYHGSEDAVNQVWTLYKEVAAYYDAGLDPPEDVTLLFPDDNQGNVYRLPTGNETRRKGGSGVYFHLEYVGLPRSYKWANTNNLSKILKELHQSYLRGADRIFVVNVGDIKPMELPFNLAMDLAWDASKLDSPAKIPHYLERYATREFGADSAPEIAAILLEHSHLVGMRRYEFVTPDTFSVLTTTRPSESSTAGSV